MNPIVEIEYNSIVKSLKNYIETLNQYGVERFIPLKSETKSGKDSLEVLNKEIEKCVFCFKGTGLPKQIFDKYPKNVKLLFLVDMPKTPETGRVFSKDERILFSRIIKAMNLRVEDVFVLPAVRCRLMPEDYNKVSQNFAASPCHDYLKRSVSFIDPQKICILGKELVSFFSNDEIRGGELLLNTYPLYSTYSLNDLIIEPYLKKEAWAKFQEIVAQEK